MSGLEPTKVCIALGSNIEPREVHLRAAIEGLDKGLLPRGRVLAVSGMHETQAEVLPGQVPGPQYLNGACVVETILAPQALLALCLDLERSRGRDRRSEGRWGARTLDLDVLLFGGREIHEPGLDVPHPRMLERLFVLVPLAEIAGDWIVPGTARSVRAHLEALRSRR
ncbi:MAG: 2-amino-4-hydroxy-6-hydroxymethyldihydropteridine diphosphokinase [Phycisphaeraceae bacterium]|nr:2-amino-4-hydroxy-6-hydroxymethyldihydropteridine diphosphokinase [Phycisphaeraceae bacterium]